MTWVGLVAALLTGVALVGVLAPFARRRSLRLQPLTGPLEDRRLQVLRTLRDLERDHARGAVAGGDYERLRLQAEADAAQLIRRLDDKEQAAELAATMRQRKDRQRPGRRHRPSHAKLVGGLAAAAISTTAVLLLPGALGGRAAGGFITGSQPSPTAASTSTPALLRHLQDHPDDLEARLDLAQTYLEAGQPRDAAQQYVQVLKRDPNNPEATTRLALLVYEAGDSDDALKGVDKVLIQSPDYPEALFLKGVILLNAQNRPQEAIAPLQRYLQVAPTGGYRADAEQLLKEAQAQVR